MPVATPLLDNPRRYLSAQMVKEVQTNAALWEMTLPKDDGDEPICADRPRLMEEICEQFRTANSGAPRILIRLRVLPACAKTNVGIA
jgi:hypothetical protein